MHFSNSSEYTKIGSKSKNELCFIQRGKGRPTVANNDNRVPDRISERLDNCKCKVSGECMWHFESRLD